MINSDPASARVLVATDHASNAAEVHSALALHFASVEVSTCAANAVADFDRVKPDVLVLAFDTLDKAQKYGVALMKDSKTAHEHPHATVTLCDKEEVQDTFELCKRGVFDDYVLYWPQWYDARRLAMAVWNSARTLGLAATLEGYRLKPESVRGTVMVVEDDSFSARLIGKALEEQPFDLAFAEDGQTLMVMLRRIKPNVILMDIGLPGMDGLALTEWLKATPALANIPVIMLTGNARRETIQRSMTAGAAGFIVKPFSREALIAKVARHLH